jgi:AraC-like DNA-binding protein
MRVPDHPLSTPTLPGPIRKEILLALGQSIIPALWQQQVALGVVRPPFHFPAGIKARHVEAKVPQSNMSATDFPIETHWPRADLHSTSSPYFGFIYEGAADERTLVTAAQATKFGIRKGIYALRWQAPGVLLIPPGVPHNGGDSRFWVGDEAPPKMTKILWLRVCSELLVHTYTEGIAVQRHSSHSLQINDRTTISLACLLVEELERSRPSDFGTATAILLALMMRLQKSLQITPPKIANTARPPLPPSLEAPDEHTSNICRHAAIFIVMHLHDSLSVAQIAHEVGPSPAHLNRLFRRFYGVSVMQYVRQQRIAAAQRILKVGNENISEIARLLGFKQASAFCSVFRRETGFTPNQFRYRARQTEAFNPPDSRLATGSRDIEPL